MGKFNAHFETAVFVQVEEVSLSGDMSANSTFSDLITNPRIGIERKGIDRHEIRSAHRFMVTGNPDWMIEASSDERRHGVLEVGEAHAQDRAYFAAIDAEMDNGGRERLMWELLNFDIKASGMNPCVAPQTEALATQKLYSLSILGRWWLDQLHGGELWDGDKHEKKDGAIGILVSKAYIRESVREWEDRYRQRRSLIREEITKQLKELCPRLENCRPRLGTPALTTAEEWSRTGGKRIAFSVIGYPCGLCAVRPSRVVWGRKWIGPRRWLSLTKRTDLGRMDRDRSAWTVTSSVSAALALRPASIFGQSAGRVNRVGKEIALTRVIPISFIYYSLWSGWSGYITRVSGKTVKARIFSA